MSNNNNPKTPQQITAETNAARTRVMVGGKDFDLYHMSEGQGAELYAALAGATDRDGHPVGEKYQLLAKSIAGFAQSFQSIVSIPGPDDMPASHRVSAFIQEVQKGSDKVSEGADKWVKDAWDSEAGKKLRSNFNDATSSGTVGTLLSGWGMVGTALDNVSRPLTAPFQAGNVWDAVKSSGSELLNKADSQISPERALAFGAAVAGASYMQMDAPDAPNSTKIPEANFFDSAQAYFEFGWKSVMHHVPVVAAFFPFLGKLIGNGFKVSDAWNEAISEAKAEHTAAVPSVDEILKENLAAKVGNIVRSNASSMLEAAEKVADLDTKPLAGAIRAGGVYRDHDGNWQELAFNKPNPVEPSIKPVVDDKGNTMSGGRDVANKWHAIGDVVLPSSMKPEALAGYGFGAYHTAKLGAGLASGTLGQMVGKNSVHAKELEKLLKPITDLQEQLLNGKPTTNKWTGKVTGHTPLTGQERVATNKQINDLQTKLKPELDKLKDKIIERENLFGPKLQAFAEKEGTYAFKFGKQVASPAGKGFSGLLSLAEHSKLNTKAGGFLYGMDAVQGGFALLNGDFHGVAENSAQLAGGFAVSKGASFTASKLIARYAPGRFKLLAPVIGLGGQLLGRKGGEELVNLAMPETTDYQRELVALQTQSTAQWAQVEQLHLQLNVNHFQLMVQLKDKPESEVIAQLVQTGAIPAELSDADKARALKLMKEMAATVEQAEKLAAKHLDLTAQTSTPAAQEEEGSPLLSNGLNAVFTGLDIYKGVGKPVATSAFSGLTRLIPALSKFMPAVQAGSKFAPGVISTGFLAVGDGYETYEAIRTGDTKGAVHNGAEIVGGLGAAVLAGLGTGAALGAVGGVGVASPITAPVGAIIGGVAAAGAYYFGSKGGGTLADKAYNYFRGTDSTVAAHVASTEAAAPKAAVTAPANMVDTDFADLMEQMKLKNAQDKARTVVFNSKVTTKVGAVNQDSDKLPNVLPPKNGASPTVIV